MESKCPHGQNDVNPHIWRMLEGAFSLDAAHIEGWTQDCSNSNIFLKPLFRGNFDPFVNNANLGVIAHTSNGT